MRVTIAFLLICVNALRESLKLSPEPPTNRTAIDLVYTGGSLSYMGTVNIGNQKLVAVYDTGSFDLLALSTQCPVCLKKQQEKAVSTMYNSSASSAFVSDSSKSKAMVFEAGTVQVSHGFDRVQLAGYTLPNASFWQVTKHDIDWWHPDQFTVIVGLGKRAVDDSDNPTILEGANINYFSLCLRRNDKNPGGILDFAPPSKDAISVSITGTYHWSFPVSSVDAGNSGSHSTCRNTKCVAIIDSGTSLLAFPLSMYQELQLEKLIWRNCSNFDSLPNLEIEIDGKKVALPPSAYVAKQESHSVGAFFMRHLGFSFRSLNAREGECVPAVLTISDDTSEGANMFILGQPFLKHYRTTFLRGDGGASLKIAKVDPDCNPTVPSLRVAESEEPMRMSLSASHSLFQSQKQYRKQKPDALKTY